MQDPVTHLPMYNSQEQSPLLLYGFSKEIVECPGYWPYNAHVCGFWFLPMEWQFSCRGCMKAFQAANELCPSHVNLQYFVEKCGSCLPIFVGLSSIGSMGFLQNPMAFVLVLKAVLDSTDYKIILFSAGHGPLDAAIQSYANSSSNSTEVQSTIEERVIFNNRLFCFSGSIPYGWIFPKCAVAIHHGGSGSTAAALQAGVPQIICPFLLDQFYWAERMCWHGVAPEPLQKKILIPDDDDVMSIEKSADTLKKAIVSALSPQIKARAVEVAERISSEDGIQEALKVLKEKVALQK